MSTRFSVVAAGMAIALTLAAVTNTTAVAQPLCTPDTLSLTTGDAPDPGTGQVAFVVFLTNVGTESCTVPAYPAVELLGPNDPQFGPSYQLPQAPGDATPVPLPAGYYVSSLLTYLPGPADGTGWVPNSIVVTLPDASKPLVTPWIPGDLSVLRQDAATNPGTYIGAFERTG